MLVFLHLRHLCFRNEWEALAATAGALGQFFGERVFFQLRNFVSCSDFFCGDYSTLECKKFR